MYVCMYLCINIIVVIVIVVVYFDKMICPKYLTCFQWVLKFLLRSTPAQ